MVAKLLLSSFAILAAIGLWNVAIFFGARTNSRLSGWLAYFALLAVPSWVFISSTAAIVAVVWGIA